MSRAQLRELRECLRESAILLSSLNLYQGAKWSAEALGSIKHSEDNEILESKTHSTHDNEYYDDMKSPSRYLKSQQTLKESDEILLARTYFDCKEFDRAAYVLRKCSSPDALFLRLYSVFLSGEKLKEEESEGVLGQNDSTSSNTSIPAILKQLDSYTSDGADIEMDDDVKQNPFLSYLNGIILLKQKCFGKAQEFLIQSIQSYPFNWSCWTELIVSISAYDEAVKVIELLSTSFSGDFAALTMLRIFEVVLNQEFFQQNDALYEELDNLIDLFPTFSFLKTQKALISYHALEYHDAERLFDEIVRMDPLRLDDMDIYSNILYVMEKKAKLAFLAQFATAIDKFRPETCCIVANYYSLKFEHEKAIMYYRRALTLNRNCLSAWTLMGHEFVELKNSHAAIESYRRAVDANIKDFKAWYGLGQAYEVLDMHLYSLFYYQRACALKPLDKRIWQALANCYKKLDKSKDSIKCYAKALQLGENADVSILFNIALLYEQMLDFDKVQEYMELCYQEEVNEGVKNDETAKARLWLARYAMRKKKWETAYNYAVDLTHGTSQEIEEARSISREARNRMNIK